MRRREFVGVIGGAAAEFLIWVREALPAAVADGGGIKAVTKPSEPRTPQP